MSEQTLDVLVVDGANVVGSRPDGWWRDRAGAAAQLHARLESAGPLAAVILLVLEGKARSGVPESASGALRVVHAAGEGDATILAEAARAASTGNSVGVVTADRALSAQVEEAGARVLRPGWLLDLLDQEATGTS